MSRRFGNGYFALVAFGIVGLLAIGFVSITFAFSKGYKSADQEHSANNANRETAEVVYSECLRTSSDLNSARKCVNNTKSTSREAERAEQDLNAQREMAKWTEGMLWAAWVVGLSTLLATIIGVRYVYLTLLATQDMARETTRIGEAQVRAYVTVSAAECSNIVPGEPITFSIKIENKGQSPARNVRLVTAYGVLPGNEHTARIHFGQNNPAVFSIGAGVSMLQSYTWPGSFLQLHIDMMKKEKMCAVLAGVISYTDVFGRHHRTIFRGFVNPISIKNGQALLTHTKKNNRSS